MKSIMEEASSILKAIEKGWAKAGQPKEFSVKIFEEPQKNFFGITTKSAKIGIFFDQKPSEKVEEFKQTKPKFQAQQQKPKPQTKVGITKEAPKREPLPEKPTPAAPRIIHKKIEAKVENNLVATEEKQPVWTDSMLKDIEQWINDIVKIIGTQNVSFNINPQRFHLKIQFHQSIFPDKIQEKQFFAGSSALLVQMLKFKYKRPLKSYKIILISA